MRRGETQAHTHLPNLGSSHEGVRLHANTGRIHSKQATGQGLLRQLASSQAHACRSDQQSLQLRPAEHTISRLTHGQHNTD